MEIRQDSYRPLVSVIMPLYKQEQFISRAIRSLIVQTFTQWELIIINDCSKDKTEEISLELAKHDDRIKYFKNINNLGVQKTRNIALGISRSEYIAEIDQDDEWIDKNKLSKQIELSFRLPPI